MTRTVSHFSEADPARIRPETDETDNEKLTNPASPNQATKETDQVKCTV
jgi:hypothetical protein